MQIWWLWEIKGTTYHINYYQWACREMQHSCFRPGPLCHLVLSWWCLLDSSLPLQVLVHPLALLMQRTHELKLSSAGSPARCPRNMTQGSCLQLEPQCACYSTHTKFLTIPWAPHAFLMILPVNPLFLLSRTSSLHLYGELLLICQDLYHLLNVYDTCNHFFICALTITTATANVSRGGDWAGNFI